MSTIKSSLKALRDAIAKLSSDAGAYDWSAGDGATAGGLMAVIGEVAEKAGLRNTGLGIATLSLTGRERFQFAAQRTAYLKASGALTCIQQVVNQLSDRDRVLALGAGEPAEVKAATSAPLEATQAVEFARAKLESDLGTVSSAPADRAALVEFSKRYVQAAEPASPSASAPRGAANTRTIMIALTGGGTQQAVAEWEVQEALNKVKAFSTELGKCRHE